MGSNETITSNNSTVQDDEADETDQNQQQNSTKVEDSDAETKSTADIDD